MRRKSVEGDCNHECLVGSWELSLPNLKDTPYKLPFKDIASEVGGLYIASAGAVATEVDMINWIAACGGR